MTDPSAGKQTIYTGIPKTYNASFDYRIVIPLATMEDLGLPVYPMVDMNEANIENDARLMAFAYSDFDLFYQPVSSSLIDNFDALQKAKGGRRPDGSWKWTPTFILDTDDDLFRIHPANPVFRTLGTTRPDGVPLMPDDEVGMVHEETGEQHVLWKDGENGFNIASNQQKVMIYRELMKRANAITVTTPEVEKYVKREVPSAWTYIYPNSLRFDSYPEVELADHPNEIRIMWQGSPTHYEDIYPLAEPMAIIARKYPQAKFVFWGAKYDFPMRHMPEGSFKFLPWVPFAEYKARLATINHDINICPLTDHQFNRCRSAIKFYESSAICKPAATLAQATGAYKAEVIEGETGLLWDSPESFVEKMSALIENVELRRTLASNAAKWVRTHRDAVKNVPALWEFYKEVRAKQMRDNPEPLVKSSEEHVAPDLEFSPVEESNL